ncbi:MAG: hypothetical protein M3Y06_10475 [Actinomycetota bacterium]|nr:hypothetical protein [Actinomycetota bacterium]
MADTYTSTVIAPAQIALGIVSGLVIAVVLLAIDAGLWPLAILALLVAGGIGYYLAPLTVSIDARHLVISQGRGDKHERIVPVDDITVVEVRTLTWQQTFGIGIESDDLTTRLTVRAGPALFVSLISGEEVRLSATDPDDAVAALARPVPPPPLPPSPTPPA